MNVYLNGDHAFLPNSGAVVTFTHSGYTAFNQSAKTGDPASSPRATSTAMGRLIQKLDVAPWGEDNRFPQNVSSQLEYSGVTKAALDFKAQALLGNGLIWGTVKGLDEKGNEIFEPAQEGDFPEVDEWMEKNDHLIRYFAEFNQDWTTFGNCFPELVLSKDGKKINRLVHQESCDCRFKQMDSKNRIQWVYLSKLWGQLADQFVTFGPKKLATAVSGGSTAALPNVVDNEFIKQLRALDPYNAREDLEAAVKEGHRNIILPVNYPSTNKTYYQLTVWDGSRKAGWVELEARIPGLLKVLYDKAFNIKYHIEIPESYMERRYGPEQWSNFTVAERDQKRQEVLAMMDKFLSGSDNAYKAFVSYFETNPDGSERGRIKITPIDNKSNLDKDLLAVATAISVILFSMKTKPSMVGAGAPGTSGGQDGSGSDTREAFLVYVALLFLERQMILEPLRLIQRYNGWDKKLKWRFRDIVLTTTDQNTGTEKKIS